MGVRRPADQHDTPVPRGLPGTRQATRPFETTKSRLPTPCAGGGTNGETNPQWQGMCGQGSSSRREAGAARSVPSSTSDTRHNLGHLKQRGVSNPRDEPGGTNGETNPQAGMAGRAAAAAWRPRRVSRADTREQRLDESTGPGGGPAVQRPHHPRGNAAAEVHRRHRRAIRACGPGEGGGEGEGGDGGGEPPPIMSTAATDDSH